MRRLTSGLRSGVRSVQQAGRRMASTGTDAGRRFAAGFSNPLKGLGTKLDGLRTKMQGLGAAGAVIGGGAAIGATRFIKDATAAYNEQAQAVAKVQNGILSTGGAAKLTLQELTAEASRLQSSTLFGDEEILNSATAQLLTFTNLAGENFTRTQAIALDLASKLDGDLKGASIQLGKALNDPVANLSALSRSGIQFSESQKNVIKSLAQSGRLADAQGVILTELERQYGGTAAAAAAAGTGGMRQLANDLGDLKEEVGAVIVAALRPLSSFLRGLVERYKALSPNVRAFIAVTVGVTTAITALVPVIGALSLVMTPIALKIAAVVAVVAALAAGAMLIIKNWEPIKAFFARMWAAVKIAFFDGTAALLSAVAGLTSVIPGIGEATANALGKAVAASKEARQEFAELSATQPEFVGMGEVFDDLSGKAKAMAGSIGSVPSAPMTNLGSATEEAGKKASRTAQAFKRLYEVAIPNGVREIGVRGADAVRVPQAVEQIEAPAPPQDVVERWLEFRVSLRRTFTEVLPQAVGQFAGAVGQSFGKLLTFSQGVKDTLLQIGGAVRQMVADIIAQLAKVALIKGISALVPGFGGLFGSAIPALATGGIVTRPSLIMAGEGREAEAVLPLSRLSSMLNASNGGGVGSFSAQTRISLGELITEVVYHDRANGGALRSYIQGG